MDTVVKAGPDSSALLEGLLGESQVRSDTRKLCGDPERPDFDVYDPATTLTIATVTGATVKHAKRAIDMASVAYLDWSRRPPRERSGVLRQAASILQQRADSFARLITLEMGKILPNSVREVELAIEYLHWFAEEVLRISGDCSMSPDGASTMLTLRKPVGVALLVTPWNFPLVTIVRKLGACTAAGCTALIKPSEETPLTALALARVFADAGGPEGLVAVLPTAEPATLVSHLIGDARIRKLSFTGSYAVGRVLQEQAARNMMRTSMELGGNAPFIVFADADLDLAVEHAVASKLSASGQVCTAPNRFLIHRAVYDAFCERLAGRFEATRIGPGSDASSDMGPVVSERARQRIIGLTGEALALGGRLMAGTNQVPDTEGFYLQPMVIADVPQQSVLWREEIFGPVAQVVPFDTDQQALNFANQSPAGLAGYIYTHDLERMMHFGELLKIGMLGVNRIAIVNAKAPFGGVGLAGFGVEGGGDGLDEYLDTTYMCVARSGPDGA